MNDRTKTIIYAIILLAAVVGMFVLHVQGVMEDSRTAGWTASE